MLNKTPISDISKSFINWLNRNGIGWGTPPDKDSDEYKLKKEFYDTYCLLLEEKKLAIDECIEVYNHKMETFDDPTIIAESRLHIANLRLEKYEVDEDLMGKKYYKESYKERDEKIRNYNRQLSEEADERLGDLIEKTKLLMESQPLDTKDNLILLGLIDRYERGFKKDKERNDCYTDLLQALQNVTMKLSSPQKSNVTATATPKFKVQL